MQDEELKKDLEESIETDTEDTDSEDDVSFEELAEGDSEEISLDPKVAMKKLRDKIKALEAEKLEYLTGWQRAKADFINMRKKDEEMQGEFMKYAKEGIIVDLLPVLDSFDLALKNKAVWESLPADWRKGMESIYTQLQNTLSSHSVTKLDLIGKPFDPRFAEAVSMQPVTEKSADGAVMDVLQSGYTLSDKTVRIAKVVVGEYHE